MSTSSSVPKDRIRIFNREGFVLAEFRASVDRSWAIGDEGRAAFTYPSRKTDVANDDVLRFGNWLLIENDTLPAWVGVIDVPQEWDARNVTVCAYTPERVFSWRIGPPEEVLTGSPGSVFEKLLQRVNQAESTVIRAGDIDRGGNQMEETINPTPLNEDLQRIFERSGEEYQWRPVILDNRLVVYADWMPRLGIDTGVILQEGKGGGNIEAASSILVEDGPIVNDLFAYGDGLTWQTKPSSRIIDPSSIGRYGLRQSSEEYTGVSNTATLQTNGTQRVKQFRNGTRTYRLNALNVGDTFKYLGLGNRFTVHFETIRFGYEAAVRVLGMVYDTDARNKVELTVEEYE